jgi:hypothetical protein
MIPIQPHFMSYEGANPRRCQDAARRNKTAQRVADYVNRKLANDPSEIQQFMFGFIAADVGIDVDDVRAAISNGGHNGITLRITEAGRFALAQYRE